MLKKTIAILSVATMLFLAACGGDAPKTTEATTDKTEAATPAADAESMVDDAVTYDPKRGEGKFDETNVNVGPVDKAMAAKGKEISTTKCFSCHKASGEKLVGPGWAGVSTRHTPYWLMNFITNPDPMIDKDPKMQAALELCLVRMPNQNIAETEAKEIVEFMRANDGVK